MSKKITNNFPIQTYISQEVMSTPEGRHKVTLGIWSAHRSSADDDDDEPGVYKITSFKCIGHLGSIKLISVSVSNRIPKKGFQ